MLVVSVKVMKAAKNLVEAYANADADFHQTVADICGIGRKASKDYRTWFDVWYG